MPLEDNKGDNRNRIKVVFIGEMKNTKKKKMDILTDRH